MDDDTFRLRSEADGAEVFVRRWRPEAPPRGWVQIVHGMAEHSARYGHVAAELVERGFGVWASDHRGHGQTIPPGESPGHFGRQDGWDRTVADLAQLQRAIRAEHPGRPGFVLGHSMGSFLTMQLMATEGRRLCGVVLSGSNGHPGFLRHVGAVVARLEERRLGPRGTSKLIDHLSFGSFNSGIADPRTSFDWLSRDPDQVDRYVEDPLCGFLLTTRSWRQFLHALRLIHRADHVARLPRELPVLIIGGSEDPVGDRGEGLVRLHDAWTRAGMTQVELRLVPGARHEVLNELERVETLGGIADWLEARIEGRR